jgi:hypothetical protein
MTQNIQNKFNNATFNSQEDFNVEYDNLLVRAGQLTYAVIKLDRAIQRCIAARLAPGVTRREVIKWRETQSTLETQRKANIDDFEDCQRKMTAIEKSLGY